MPPSRIVRGRRARARWIGTVAAVALALAVSGCRFVVATGPTPVRGGTIVFVVVDDGDRLVGSTHITVRAVAGGWTESGLTAGGRYECRVRAGVNEVSIWVEPPEGFALADGGWPRRVDVSGSGALEIRIRVRRIR